MYQTPNWHLAETPEAAAAREAHNKKTAHQAARAALELAQAASQPNAYIEILTAAGPANVDVTIVNPKDGDPKQEGTRRTSRLTQIRRCACAPAQQESVSQHEDASQNVRGAPRLVASDRSRSCHSAWRRKPTREPTVQSAH